MKNKSYLPLIERAIQLGCRVDNGSKHAKIFGPDGKLLQVLSVNGSKQCYDIASQIRKLERMLGNGN